MLDELADFTMELITGVLFGDYATPELMKDVKNFLPALSKAMFSFPVRFPWPLNKVPVFGYGKSMDAREAFSGVIRGVLDERRADILSVGEDSSGTAGGKSAGILDSLIELQQREKVSEEGQEGTFNDDFIVDTVRVDHLWPRDSLSLRTMSLLSHHWRPWADSTDYPSTVLPNR